jgi:hypothetical protein
MDKELIMKLQAALKKAGFDPKGVDGVIGPDTEKAIIAFKKSKGLAARPYIGPLTLEALIGEEPPEDAVVQLPWINQLAKHMGWDEKIDNQALREWLKSDGSTVGDPAKIPWCGDCMETAIRLGLPGEWAITDKRLTVNPYWAQNWQYFGLPSERLYGALGAFVRPAGGHIACLIGYDPGLKRLRIRGGNQSNRVGDTWIDANRMIACRRPQKWDHDLPALPVMNSRGEIVSTNEA